MKKEIPENTYAAETAQPRKMAPIVVDIPPLMTLWLAWARGRIQEANAVAEENLRSRRCSIWYECEGKRKTGVSKGRQAAFKQFLKGKWKLLRGRELQSML